MDFQIYQVTWAPLLFGMKICFTKLFVTLLKRKKEKDKGGKMKGCNHPRSTFVNLSLWLSNKFVPRSRHSGGQIKGRICMIMLKRDIVTILHLYVM